MNSIAVRIRADTYGSLTIRGNIVGEGDWQYAAETGRQVATWGPGLSTPLVPNAGSCQARSKEEPLGAQRFKALRPTAGGDRSFSGMSKSLLRLFYAT